MANITDVARVAGVSISTVSYALSGKRPIADATKTRIAQAVTELGYRPNAGARMLAGSRTNIFALTAPMHEDTHPPALMSFVLSVVTAARSYDYDVLLLTEGEATTGLRRVVSSSLVDGIIMLDVTVEDERIDVIRELGLPTTLIGIPHDTEGLTCVDLDFEGAARLAVSRLVALGHTSIGLMGHAEALYERGSNYAPRFRDAFLAAGSDAGIQTAFHTTVATRPGVEESLDGLRAQLPGMTALVLNCNENIHGILLEVLREREVAVPEALSIVSACSSFSTDHFLPPMDVIPLPSQESGRRAVELAIQQIAGFADPHVELIAPVYHRKSSTAPPAATVAA
ncbi:LacI family DNA-binding transcriptional regulator [Cryobacterium arcticum]|uniref:LacI family transcriptional regulator n=1 Tax=Cryobacterium arcticum TaxID=670052 RepID=A0A1B1BEQ6_9MICO|nr:LacI family DNA-binding transcriptional regulator [Cryobacterium arcticum]ANP71047.1 LacI family transcriptional regulator [Cryobacterium arcticum]